MAFSQRISNGANIRSRRWAIRTRFDFIPESVEVSSSCMVMGEMICRVCNPERCHRYISLHHVPRFQRTNGQIILNNILSLYAIFNEEVVTLHDVSDVFSHTEEVYGMESDNSCERVMHSIAFNVGISDISIHVKVNTISSDNSRLSAVGKLSISNVGNHSFFTTAEHHQVRSVLAPNRSRISPHFDISGEKTHFSFHLKSLRSEVLYA